MTQGESNRPIAAVLTTFRVLEEVAQRQPVGVGDIARSLGVPKSTVQRGLVTLNHAGWLCIVDAERVKWGLTSKPLAIGLRAAGEDGLRESAQPYIQELRDTTTETVHLSVRDGSGLLILDRYDSTQAVRTYVDVGARAPMYTSSGIAILAHLPADQVDTIIDVSLEQAPTGVTVSRDDILEKVEIARQAGYAVNARSWWRTEVSAVAAAVIGVSGRPVAAVAVSIPSSRFHADQVGFWGVRVTDAADKITKVLQAY